MTASPHTIGVDQSLAAATQMMQAHKVRHLPVLRGGEMVGLLSERDIQLVAGLPSVDPATFTVEDAMSEPVYSVTPDTPLEEVAAEMAAHKYGAAVVTEGGHIAGVFTSVDALYALADGAPTRNRRAPGA